MLVGVDVDTVEVEEESELETEVRVDASDGFAKNLRSVSCHQTGIPSPYILYGSPVVEYVVVKSSLPLPPVRTYLSPLNEGDLK